MPCPKLALKPSGPTTEEAPVLLLMLCRLSSTMSYPNIWPALLMPMPMAQPIVGIAPITEAVTASKSTEMSVLPPPHPPGTVTAKKSPDVGSNDIPVVWLAVATVPRSVRTPVLMSTVWKRPPLSMQ